MHHPTGRELDLETGLVTLSEKQQVFLDWLTGERENESQAQFAARIGVAQSTIVRWKKDPSFLQMWQDRMVATHAHPDTLSKQLANLNTMAQGSGPDAIRATELYWKLVDKMTPERVVVTGADEAAGLSEAELAERLQKAAEAAVARARPESAQEQAARVREDLGIRSA